MCLNLLLGPEIYTVSGSSLKQRCTNSKVVAANRDIECLIYLLETEISFFLVFAETRDVNFLRQLPETETYVFISSCCNRTQTVCHIVA